MPILQRWIDEQAKKASLPKSRKQRFQELLDEIQRRKRTTTPPSSLKRQLRRKTRAEIIKSNPNLVEFFNWMFWIQSTLKLKDKDFAQKLGISKRMLYYYKKLDGHTPSEKVFKRLLNLEKLCKANITIVTNRTTMIKTKPIHSVLIE